MTYFQYRVLAPPILLAVFWTVFLAGFLALAQEAPPSQDLIQHRRAKLHKQLELVSCEQKVWEAPIYPAQVHQGLSSCMEFVFSNRESFCRMDVEYRYDYLSPGEQYRLRRYFAEFFLQSGHLRDCFENPAGDFVNIDYKYDQLRALALCMEADEFQDTINDEESAEWLASCMSELSYSRRYLDAKYDYVKSQLRVFKINNTIDSVIERICMRHQDDGADYNWCQEFGEGLKN